MPDWTDTHAYWISVSMAVTALVLLAFGLDDLGSALAFINFGWIMALDMGMDRTPGVTHA